MKPSKRSVTAARSARVPVPPATQRKLRRQLGESMRVTPADAHPCDRPAVRTLVFSLTALEGAYRRHQLRLSDYIKHRRDLLSRLGRALVEVYDLYFARVRADAKAATKRTKAKRRRRGNKRR